MSTSPDTAQTIPANERTAFNVEQQKLVDFMNAQLAAYYQQAVNNWIGKQAHGPTSDPVPVPPKKWAALPETNLTPEEVAYNLRFSLAPELVPTITSDFVAPQFAPPSPAPPAPPAGTVVSIGPYLRDGEYAALPLDNMPDGYMTSGPNGQVLRKVVKPTPFGNAQWYQVVA